MKKLAALLLTFSVVALQAQTFKEKELKTNIKEVTVFLNGAQVFEAGSTAIPVGTTLLRIKGLSPFIDEKSVQVKAEGDFTILAVNHKLSYLNELKKDGKMDSLKKRIDVIKLSVSRVAARLEMLVEKLSLLNANKTLGGANAGVSIIQLRQAIELYESEILKIKEEEIKLKQSIEKKKIDQANLENELKDINARPTLPSSEIEVRIDSETQGTGKFLVTYVVSNAGWFPKYDIRVTDIKQPLTLNYKAEVFQNTGVDWNNVKLRFSNGDPNKSGVLPSLNTWNLNFARNTIFVKPSNALAFVNGTVKGKVMDENGEPLPGVNVLIKGTTVGTVTDASGTYNLTLPNGASQLVFSFIGFATQEIAITQPEIDVLLQQDIQQLQEVVATGYGLQGKAQGVQIRGANSIAKSIETKVVENQTTVEIEVERPYSIKTNGEKLVVDLKQHNVDALYEYYAVPKMDKDAFLVARVINWDQYNLLQGEANLYFEDAYIGRTILDARALKDTLDISLGRDRSIVVSRERIEELSRSRLIGSNKVDKRSFKIVVRNKKSVPINLVLYDQIPVSVISEIAVNALELTGGQLDEKSGKVTWKLLIERQQQKELNFLYEVKYPKKEKVILE